MIDDESPFSLDESLPHARPGLIDEKLYESPFNMATTMKKKSCMSLSSSPATSCLIGKRDFIIFCIDPVEIEWFELEKACH